MAEDNNTVVLCGASAYEEKYYLNQNFESLPQGIKDELQIMCVLFTNEVGGVLLLEFNKDGRLEFVTEAREDDYSYDDIGSSLKIKELRTEKEDLLRGLEMYYQVITGMIRPEDL